MSTTQRRASIADVARRAGVSIGTVSNVLNRPAAVTPATRARVEDAIKELSFVPSSAARRLRKGWVTTVGAILLDVRNPFFTEMARGIEDRLALDDYTLMLASSDDDPDREARYLRLFQEQGVFGYLLFPGSSGIDHLTALRQRGARVVLLDYPSPSPEISSVAVDNAGGAAAAVEHLVSQGHEHITFLNGPHSIRQCVERLRGARQAAEAAGLDPDVAITEVTLASLDAASGDQALCALVEQNDGTPPAAVFCVNDLVAFGVQRALRRIGGSRLLAATAVVGYDDLDTSSELAVPLTSVRQPAHEMGYRAADLLLTSDSDAPAQHVVFDPELVVRESSTVRPGA